MLPSSLVAVYNSKEPLAGNAAVQGGLSGLATALGFDLHRCLNVVKLAYSFAVNGGGVGNITPFDDQGNAVVLPAGCLVKRSYTIVGSAGAVTSAGAATVAISTGQTAADLLAATAKATFANNALVDGIPTGTMATAILITAAVSPYFTVGTAALTAGQFNTYIEYVF